VRARRQLHCCIAWAFASSLVGLGKLVAIIFRIASAVLRLLAVSLPDRTESDRCHVRLRLQSASLAAPASLAAGGSGASSAADGGPAAANNRGRADVVAAVGDPRDHTILIVDDDPINVHILTTVLGNEGYGTLSANTGFKALEVFAQSVPRPSCVLLDIGLPDISGATLAAC
jgi:PleD family two-component response regulator